ncbi:MAG: hypothetical protein KatS3mg131_1937 [Candidatus Tectimicrobiota bacterium]|nr:MAG: hypothetical protein KatS3mg131_1937 [Candidatus Tectomicrobia bacterium]
MFDEGLSPWWDVYVQVPSPLSDAVSACLHRLEAGAVVLHDDTVLAAEAVARLQGGPQAAGWTVVQGAWPADAAFLARLQALQQALYDWTAWLPGLRWQLACRQQHQHDYLTQWQRFFTPLVIAERLLIRPPWEKGPVPAGMACVELEPSMAFGTGLHPTTQLCLTLLVQALAGHPQGCLLDVGCGSGILALAALKLGLPRAVGVDIDPQAVAVARHNAARNGLRDQVAFLHGSWEVAKGPYTHLVANLYLEPLLALAGALPELLLPGGCGIVSGILETQEAPLREALQAAGLAVSARLAREGWVALRADRR